MTQKFEPYTEEEIAALKRQAIENLKTPCPTHTPIEVLRLIATLEELHRTG